VEAARRGSRVHGGRGSTAGSTDVPSAVLACGDLRRQVLNRLADGQPWSGAALARELGVSRTAVWQHVRALADLGLGVESSRGRGYRLERVLDLLDTRTIEAALGREARRRLQPLSILIETDSTNQRLLERAATSDIHGAVCMAEFQHAGRGRRGRQWRAPLGAGLCMSLGWRFDDAAALAGLSLAAGVAVRAALAELGTTGVQLKWPNDLLWRGRKLGGILIEMRGEFGGPCTTITGVGLNVCLPPAMLAATDPPCIDVREIMGRSIDRNRLAARVLAALQSAYTRFATHGFRGVMDDWARHDALNGRQVIVEAGGRHWTGVARGVGEDGSLIIVTDGGGEQRFHGGEVSVRGT